MRSSLHNLEIINRRIRINESNGRSTDQMNMVLALDNSVAKDMESLAPHKNMLDLNQPRSLSSAASIPKPVASTISRWLCDNDAVAFDPQKQAFLESLAVH
jgi:hypothetical protein